MAFYTQAIEKTVGEPRYIFRGPMGLPWACTAIAAEILFVISRASIQNEFKIDDPLNWIMGLSPFLVDFFIPSLYRRFTVAFLSVWLLALVMIVIAQMADLTQFIDYPLFRQFDEGLYRWMAYSAFYTVVGALAFLVIKLCLSPSSIRSSTLPLICAVPAVSVSLAFALFISF